MRSKHHITTVVAVSLGGGLATPLNMTAISSRDGYSVLECWQLASVPVDAMSAANYAVGGNATAATWSHIEPRTRVGEAWAPHVQLSIILNGLIRITSPAPAADTSTTANASGSIASVLPREVEVASSARPDTHVAYIMPGTLRSSVVIAADLKAASTLAGHFTEFPSDEPTVLVQIPFARDAAPEHTVLHDGPCTG